MSCAVVIPARYASTRFPGKPLHLLAGRPLLQHVWDRCRACRNIARIVVATDDERIAAAATSFGAEVCMTSPHHQSGTDRAAEAARTLDGIVRIINVQGDEPLVAPELIDELAARMERHSHIGMITAVHALDDPALLDDPNVVKCVLTRDDRALYFSRSRIPHPRVTDPAPVHWRHIGIYGFTRGFLETFVAWDRGMLETAESLEQLRALENGAAIHVVRTTHDSPGIDTPEQAAALEARLRGNIH